MKMLKDKFAEIVVALIMVGITAVSTSVITTKLNAAAIEQLTKEVGCLKEEKVSEDVYNVTVANINTNIADVKNDVKDIKQLLIQLARR